MNLKRKKQLNTNSQIAKLNQEIIILQDMYLKGKIGKGQFDFDYSKKVKELLELY